MDTVNPARQDGVVYRIPCECAKVYIGETGRPMREDERTRQGCTFSPYPDLRRF